MAAVAAAAAAAGHGGGAAKRPPAPPLLLCGPAGGGREALANQLLSRLPDVFVMAPRITDRKPAPQAAASAPPGANKALTGPAGLGTVGGAHAAEAEVVKPEMMAKMAAAGQLALTWQDPAGGQVAVTVEALKTLSVAGGKTRAGGAWLAPGAKLKVMQEVLQVSPTMTSPCVPCVPLLTHYDEVLLRLAHKTPCRQGCYFGGIHC
jgi:hypothetical protein